MDICLGTHRGFDFGGVDKAGWLNRPLMKGASRSRGRRIAEIPPLVTNAKLREKSAARMEQAADDLELLNLRFSTTRLWSDPEFRDKLREYARELRAIGLRGKAHRPKNKEFGNLAVMLTDEFRKRTGKPLWDLTAELMEQALVHHSVNDWKDSVKKAVKRRRRESARGV